MYNMYNMYNRCFRSNSITEESPILLHHCLHAIRNAKRFSKEELIEINNMHPEDRLKLLIAYNEMVLHLSDVIEDVHKSDCSTPHK